MEVGAHERELAMEALDTHRRAGRLDRTEHAGRCGEASRATTLGELDALFTDLPDPHPRFPRPATTRREDAAPEVPAAPDLPELVAPAGAAIARHATLISLLTPAAAAVLFAVSGFRIPWIFILVPVVLAVVAWLAHRHAP